MEPGTFAVMERIANSLGNMARDLSGIRQELKDIKELMKEAKDKKEKLEYLENRLNNAHGSTKGAT